MQRREYYKNGYGVSIVDNDFSYGLELAVFIWTGSWDSKKNEPKEIKSYNLCYDTPITDDVLGYLNNKTLNEAIEKVKKLKGDCND